VSLGRVTRSSGSTPGALSASGVVVWAAMRMVAPMVAIAALGGGATGCIREGVFDPIGDEIALEGHWMVNGAAASTDVCAAARIATVEVVLYDGGDVRRFDALKYDCGLGAFDTDTRGVLKRGDYVVQWRAYADDGTERARSATELLELTDVPTGTHHVLQPADFRPTLP